MLQVGEVVGRWQITELGQAALKFQGKDAIHLCVWAVDPATLEETSNAIRITDPEDPAVGREVAHDVLRLWLTEAPAFARRIRCQHFSV